MLEARHSLSPFGIDVAACQRRNDGSEQFLAEQLAGFDSGNLNLASVSVGRAPDQAMLGFLFSHRSSIPHEMDLRTNLKMFL